MLTSQTALGYVERIEAVRDQAAKRERAILAELRGESDYEQNQDKDILEVIRLREEARQAHDDANVILSSFDWVYDEADGENKRKQAA